MLRAGKKDDPELFRLRREDGASYEVTIDNGDNGLSPPPQPGNHFGLYYEALNSEPGEAEILIAPNGGTSTGDCIETFFSKSHSLGDGR